jgi:CCR4-NOT transcription complex subunit 4
VAEKNAEKKHKTQKVKPKAAPPPTAMSTVESKKHLASVRVIQRNLVYIIGLPAHLCHESVSSHPDLSKLCVICLNFTSHTNSTTISCLGT